MLQVEHKQSVWHHFLSLDYVLTIVANAIYYASEDTNEGSICNFHIGHCIRGGENIYNCLKPQPHPDTYLWNKMQWHAYKMWWYKNLTLNVMKKSHKSSEVGDAHGNDIQLTIL